MSKVLICCDASHLIGLGHVMRCLTLAHELHARGIDCVFLTNEGGRQVIQDHTNVEFESISSNLQTTDDKLILNAVKKTKANYVVWDSYQMTEEHVKEVSGFVPLLVVDDTYLLPYYACDAILNQNLYADPQKYKASQNTTIMAGGIFTLLRSQFLKLQKKQSASKIPRILLTFGGADPDNLTCRVFEWLAKLPFVIHLDIIIGTHYIFAEQLVSLIEKFSSIHTIHYYKNVSNMAEIMANQDLVLCAGGSTLYELACLGVPSCCIVVADNQMELAQKADSLGFSKNLGRIEKLRAEKVLSQTTSLLNDHDLRKRMSECGQKSIDGKGAARVASYIIERLNGKEVR